MDYSEVCPHTIRLIEKLKSLDTQNLLDFDLINKGIYFAKEYHAGQLRKSGEPFYSHPLEVAYIVSDYSLKTEVIVTSILHCHCQLKRDHLFAPKRDHLSQKFLAHGNLTFLILSPITWSGNFNHFSMMS